MTIIWNTVFGLQQSYNYVERVSLFAPYNEKIQSVLFEGIKKGVFSTAKFDSLPELLFARLLEYDADVQNWLRPAPQEFNITYNHGHSYEPDFVVETENVIYLVEVKGEDKLNDPDVVAKKKRGIQYCDVVTRWGKVNGYKEWCYLFIPSKQIMPNSTFLQLAQRFHSLILFPFINSQKMPHNRHYCPLCGILNYQIRNRRCRWCGDAAPRRGCWKRR